MAMRPSFSVSIAMRYPLPISPRTFSAGTWQSSKSNSQVEDARIPSLSSFLPTLKPGESRSTKKAVMPRCPALGSALAKTRNKPDSLALVIHSLRPLMTNASPFRSALVCMAKASLPDPASESA